MCVFWQNNLDLKVSAELEAFTHFPHGIEETLCSFPWLLKERAVLYNYIGQCFPHLSVVTLLPSTSFTSVKIKIPNAGINNWLFTKWMTPLGVTASSLETADAGIYVGLVAVLVLPLAASSISNSPVFLLESIHSFQSNTRWSYFLKLILHRKRTLEMSAVHRSWWHSGITGSLSLVLWEDSEILMAFPSSSLSLGNCGNHWYFVIWSPAELLLL